MHTSETAWCWVGQDFSDNEAKLEQLAVKFKVKVLQGNIVFEREITFDSSTIYNEIMNQCFRLLN